MPDYQKGKIYKLWSPSKNIVYYGSTIETLSSRLSKHIYSHKKYNEDNNNGYCSSYLVLDCEDYKMELIEEYACNNKSQLCKKEGEYQKNNECVNNQIAGRNKREWEKDNPNKVADWWKKNPDKKKEYGRVRRQKEGNKEEMKEKSKEYYEKNKEYLVAKQKAYYEANKEKINEERRKKRQDNLNKKDEIK
jgi:hypothetical protein